MSWVLPPDAPAEAAKTAETHRASALRMSSRRIFRNVSSLEIGRYQPPHGREADQAFVSRNGRESQRGTDREAPRAPLARSAQGEADRIDRDQRSVRARNQVGPMWDPDQPR